MDTADKIGLFPVFELIAGHSLLRTLLICLFLTPVAMIPGLIWVWYLIKDSTLGNRDPAVLRIKCQNAHVADWKPFWQH